MEQVVWVAGQKRERFTEFKRVARALGFHYTRMLFGASYGMKGAGA